MVKCILLFGVYTVVSYLFIFYVFRPSSQQMCDGVTQVRVVLLTSRYTSTQVLSQGLLSILSGFFHLSKKNTCLHGWTLGGRGGGGGSLHWDTLYDTSMTILFKHTFYRCHSFLRGTLLVLIYVSIKQYGYNGFMALLALGETGERPTADTDRGDL